MTKGLKSENLELVILFLYSIIGYACFLKNSSQSGQGHSSSLKCSHIELLSLRIRKAQSAQSTGKGKKIYVGHTESVHEVVDAYLLDED